MSLYEMFSADPMHQIEHGLWGKHIWPWTKTSYLLKDELDELDARSVGHSAQQLSADVRLASTKVYGNSGDIRIAPLLKWNLQAQIHHC